MSNAREHAEKNQLNYNQDAANHSKLDLDSTLYLAYRDIPQLLKEYLGATYEKRTCRALDFGCGAGLSTELVAKMLMDLNFEVDIFGIDINEQNINFAKQRMPRGTFVKINENDSLESLGEFDLIICNFVLVENKQDKMTDILKKLQSRLSDSGIAIVTNCASKAYRKTNKWYSFGNDFPENEPRVLKNGKMKFEEDQPIKVQVGRNGFTFFDFFHSGAAYRSSYQSAGLNLLKTHKPIGRESDGIEWQSENDYSPYKIHVLSKQTQFRNELKK